MSSTMSLLVVAALAAVQPSPYEVERFVKHEAPVTSVLITPGNEVVTAGNDGRVRRWDLKTLKEKGHEPVKTSAEEVRMSMSADGDLLSAVWEDDILYIWVRDFPKAGVFKHTDEPALYSSAFSPDGKLLAAGGVKGSVALFDTTDIYKDGKFTVRSNDKLGELGVDMLPDAMTFMPDSKTLLVLGEVDEELFELQRWDVQNKKKLAAEECDGFAFALSPNAKLLVAGRAVWDVASLKPLVTLKPTRMLMAAAFSPDSKWLVSGGTDNRLMFWNAQTGQRIATVRAHDDEINSIALTKDGKYLVSASDDYTARVWDVAKILAEKPNDEPFAKLAKLPHAYDAWRLGVCWAQGMSNYKPGQPLPALLNEANRRAKTLGITLPAPPENNDLRSIVEFLSGNQEKIAEEVRAKYDQTHGELFLSGALFPTLQMFFDPSNDAMKQMRDEILPSMRDEFGKAFGSLPMMFDRVENDLVERVDQETMSETLGMLIREIDLHLESQATAPK